jgi:hypothetical protein
MDGLKMLRGVSIFRTVAASHVAAYEAHPQMDPRIAKLYAFFATLGAGLDLTDFFDVRTGISHGKRSSELRSRPDGKRPGRNNPAANGMLIAGLEPEKGPEKAERPTSE